MDANKGKSKSNLCKISKYLHILIFQYLKIKELFRVSAASRSLLKSSKDNGVWEKYFPNERRLTEYMRKYKGININKRDLYINDMKVIGNMTKNKRY